jgi:ubiquinol-cytochrome c reductase cytochrome b subunit
MRRWLDERTGIEGAASRILSEEIPASSGWAQVFGSVALFLFMLQAFTGILLAFNYSPAPGDAYLSVQYMMTQITDGKVIRGLHHWGASMMIIVVVLHMIQVFLYGAYKKPREVTWIIGVVLLVMVLGFGLTGYLLPWDNRAYWGTVVVTKIASQVPLAGRYVVRLLGSDQAITPITFARFYGLHVLVIPAVTTLLILFHLLLVRRHGITPSWDDDFMPRKPFYPGQVFKDTVAIFAVFCVLFIMTLVLRVPLERMADPSDITYIPRPEWYFLFLFQLLKLLRGPMEVVASAILPGVTVLALILVPFVDRGRVVRLTRRIIAFAFVGLALGIWTALTAAAVASTPRP